MNSLESAVFDYSAKMEEDEFTKFGTNEELEFINNSLARMKEWLDEVPDDIDAEKLKEKRRDLVKPIRKLKNRKRQKEVSFQFGFMGIHFSSYRNAKTSKATFLLTYFPIFTSITVGP